MGYIYKVTNIKNGKVYIGQTSRSIDVRWSEHVRYSSNPNIDYASKLYYAIQKYGESAFNIEQIEECDNKLLDEREQYWIEVYHSCESGYNISRGGQGVVRTDEKEINELWLQGLSVKEIANKLYISKQTVAKHLKHNGVKVYDILSRGNKAAAKCKKVVRISENGKEVIVYNSFTEAAKKNNLTTGQISMVCSGDRQYAGGFRWKCFEEIDKQNDFKSSPSKYRHKKQVHQYTLDGKYICSFDSISQAARSFGTTSTRTISCACEKESRSGYGFRWSFEKYDVLPEYTKSISKSA